MVSLLGALSAMADVVVIDGAPVLPVTDSVVLSAQVDGVIVVARSGKTHRSRAAEARHRLESVGAHIAGWVLNGISPSAAGSYYGDYQYLARTSQERSRAGVLADRVRGRRSPS
jgi:receptor protein-tyrosine kinase